MKSKVFLLIIMLVLGSSFASAGLWDWLTGLVTGNETVTPQTIYVDKSESFTLNVGDTAIFLISGHERKIILTQINGDTTHVTYSFKANTGEQYTETASVDVGSIYIPDASYKINSLFVNDTSADFMFETFPSLPLPNLDEGCTTKTRSAIWDAERYWENLGLDTSQDPEIKYYRIRWSNGYWSRWYEAGVDDKDWKVNGDGSRRRVWSYFRDHYHQYVECIESEPEDNETTPEPEPATCIDNDGGKDYYVSSSVSWSDGGTGCIDSCFGNEVSECYCVTTTNTTTERFVCPNGCANGECLDQVNETEPEPICSSHSECGITGYQGDYFCSNGDVYKNYVNHTCMNSGTPESYCAEGSYPSLIDSCLDNEYCAEGIAECQIIESNETNQTITCSNDIGCGTPEFWGYYCSDNNVYSNYINFTCLNPGTPNSYCYNSSFSIIMEECSYGCSNGECLQQQNETNQTINCYGDADCDDSGFTGQYYCDGNSIYRDFIGGECINPESFDSYCSDSTISILIAECVGDSYCINEQPTCYTPNASNASVTTVGLQQLSPPVSMVEEVERTAESAEPCNGCMLDEACVNFGYRYSGQYCNIDKEFINQKPVNATCENHFECDNNLCLDSECVSGNLVFMQKFFMWLKTLIGMGS